MPVNIRHFSVEMCLFYLSFITIVLPSLLEYSGRAPSDAWGSIYPSLPWCLPYSSVISSMGSALSRSSSTSITFLRLCFLLTRSHSPWRKPEKSPRRAGIQTRYSVYTKDRLDLISSPVATLYPYYSLISSSCSVLTPPALGGLSQLFVCYFFKNFSSLSEIL